MHLTSKQFARAAAIAEEIESLEKQVNDLLQGKEVTLQPESSPKAPPARRVPAPKKIATSAPVASNEERGTLTPAVVRILKRSKKPLRAADIYNACGSGVSFYGQRAEESPRNSTLQDVRSPGSWRGTVSGRVKVEANTFRKHSHKTWNFERCPPPSYRSQRPAAL